MQQISRTLIFAVVASLGLAACGDGSSFVPPPVVPPPVPSNDASLSDLTISAGTLSPAFQTDVKIYTASVGFLTTEISVTAVTTNAGAMVAVNTVPAISGSPSGAILLTEGLNTITVDTTAQDTTTRDSYSIEITRESASSFAQQAYIKASNTDAGDSFGRSVALYENTLVIGANREDSSATGINGDQSDNSAVGAGAVYVFTRDATGTWIQQAYLKASNSEAGDDFGLSVAVYEDTLAVGAQFEDSAGTGVNADQSDNSAGNSGAAYVFTRDAAGIWTQQAYIKASNTDQGDRFGRPVVLYGNTLAVGARVEESASTGINGDQSNNSAADSGAVYVFTRDQSSTWSQEAYIKASNTDPTDDFGLSLALYENTLAVGANTEDSGATGIDGDQLDNSVSGAGAVYVFTRDQVGTWSQQAYVKASDPDVSDQFGWSVALYGDTLAVGAYLEDSASIGIGGDPSDNTARDTGAVFMFSRDQGGIWSQQAYVKASNADPFDKFGFTVVLYKNILAVSATGESSVATGVNGDELDNSATNAGGAYLFVRDGFGDWTQIFYVKASNTGLGDAFNWVTVFGDTLAVGANAEGSSSTGVNGDQSNNAAADAGAVYVFQ